MLRKKLEEMGINLPRAAKPLASYVPSKRSGNLIFISGQLPLKEGELLMKGPMTPDRDLEEAIQAMETAFLNGLAAAELVVDLDEIKEVIRLGAFVASTPDFTLQHKVANGASDMAQKLFGEAGIHARAAIGVPSLPLDATVELEILFQV